MKCPICRADPKFVRTFETIQHRNMTERRKLCIKCSSAWKTIEEVFENPNDVTPNTIKTTGEIPEKAGDWNSVFKK